MDWITPLYPEERAAIEALARIYPNCRIQVVNGYTGQSIAGLHPDQPTKHYVTLTVFQCQLDERVTHDQNGDKA